MQWRWEIIKPREGIMRCGLDFRNGAQYVSCIDGEKLDFQWRNANYAVGQTSVTVPGRRKCQSFSFVILGEIWDKLILI